MATFPTLPVATWVPNHLPTAAELQATLSGITLALKPPGAIVKLATAISIPNNSSTTVTWDTLEFDNDTMTSIPGTTLTVKSAGVFDIDCTVTFDPGATGIRLVYVQVNGTIVAGDSTNGLTGGGTGTSLSVSFSRLMAVNDTITVNVYQNQGTALNLQGNAGGSIAARLSAIYRSSN